MSIAVRCPNPACKRLVRVSESLRGQRMKCPACGGALRVPEDVGALPLSEEAAAPVRPPPPAASISQKVADEAAGMTSAISPILKMVLAFVFLAGLVVLGVEVIFPMLWADKPITSVARNPDGNADADGTGRTEPTEAAPLSEKIRAQFIGLIDAGSWSTARDLLGRLRADPRVLQQDVTDLELALRKAVDARVAAVGDEIDGLIEKADWDGARSKIDGLAEIDPDAPLGERFKALAERIRRGRVGALIARSQETAGAKDFDAASELVQEALKLDASDGDARKWRDDLAARMRAGVKFNLGDVVGEVWLDGVKIGDTSRTIWELGDKTRLTFRVCAPGRVPREVRESLRIGSLKVVPVDLAPAAPDAFWISKLVDTDAQRWLACRIAPEGHPAIADYARTLEQKCTRAKPNDRKRTIWKVKMTKGGTHDAQDYSVLGNSVRFVDLKTGEAVKCTKAEVKSADKLPLDEGVRRWLAGLKQRGADVHDPCEAFAQYGKFVELFPDKMDALLETCGDPLRAVAAKLAQAVSCHPYDASARRDQMDLLARLDAEIAVWQFVGQPPPQAVLEQKRNAR